MRMGLSRCVSLSLGPILLCADDEGKVAFVGVIDPLNPAVETPEHVCEVSAEAIAFPSLAHFHRRP